MNRKRIHLRYDGNSVSLRNESGQPKPSTLAAWSSYGTIQLCPCTVVNLCLTNHPPLRFDHLIQWINISTIPPLRNDYSVFTRPSGDIVEVKLIN
ncbi:hypothetical protein AVEN_116680-1 [Araneus ventricosus]|uniref:Uncharacterized protein n=1 Tax=Araneus ventricosus TaxID=182803 RepID=A0A4Y2L442_ARAVE|nr:hypothetical protein AVEN_116680-1 [Araneus ventricosus]